MFTQRGEVCNLVPRNQIASLGYCEIQGFYRTGKFDYFLSNNATVESRMLHQHLTWHRDNNGKFHWAFGAL